MIPAFYVQRNIARVESVGVAISGSNVVYTFRNHSFVDSPYNGIVIIKLLAVPSDATSTQPIVFNSGNGNVNLTKVGGVNATVADITGAGIYLTYYDSSTGTLQLI